MKHKDVMMARRIELGELVRKIIHDRKGSLSIHSIAQELAPYIGLTISGLKCYLNLMHSDSAGIKIPYDHTDAKGLERLTIILYSLGVSAEEQVIQELTKTYPAIVYPPANYKQIPRLGRDA